MCRTFRLLRGGPNLDQEQMNQSHSAHESNRASHSARASSHVEPQPDSSTATDAEPESQDWNLLILAAHHILHRLAWIFKTETVLIPAFLDVIAGPGWIRGCLPILNRLGQSLPPLWAAPRVRQSRRKVRWLIGTSLLMGLLFAWLSLLCWHLDNGPMFGLPWIFLAIYTLFFASSGINQMAFNTVQGKLIPPMRRGRLMSLGGLGGSLVAISAAYLLLTPWLQLPNGQAFTRVFGFTALAFTLAGLVLFWLREPADPPGSAPARVSGLLRNVLQTWRTDRPFRRLACVTMLFMGTFLLFPHYQWLGRSTLGSAGTDLMWWVILQNASVGLFSWLAGSIADRYGYRIVLCCEMFVAGCIPLVALGLSQWLTPELRGWYAITFFMLGLIPVTVKSLFNYTLELTREEQHPHYLSSLSVCMALPVFLAPLVGWLLDRSPAAVFLAIAALILAGALLAITLHEPRRKK